MQKEFNPANRLSLNYFEEASKFSKLPFPIIDAHTHINGLSAAKIYSKAAEIFGVSLTYSMTRFSQIDEIREVLGDRIRFITMPTFAEEEQYYNDVSGYMKYIRAFYDKGSRILKFWAAPRGRDIGIGFNKPDLLALGSPRRKEIMREASKMNMVFMVHVSDPDTWFKAKYSDERKYGTKRSQYESLEEALATYQVPFIAAHMGGWPEDLEFLSGLLSRHKNLYLDTSATKWIVREVSKHSREDLVSFLERWKGRILFGSDIVTYDTHLDTSLETNLLFTLPELEERAFDLYASRYYALRVLFEREGNFESPIADPDLHLTEPERFTERDAPQINAKNLPAAILESLYFKAANDLLEPFHTGIK